MRPQLLLFLLLASLFRSAMADTTPPAITSIAIAPAVADITAGPVAMTATITITDESSGFATGYLFLYNPDGGFVSNTFFNSAQRVFGDASSGTYDVTFNVPALAAAGNWRVDAMVTDVAFNTRFYDATATNPFPIPSDALFTVTNSGSVDTTSPELIAASTNPTTVDTGAGSATVTFTIEVSDSEAGFNYGLIYPNSPTTGLQHELITEFNDLNRVSGDEYSGIYEVTMTLPAGSDPGTWVYDVDLNDRVGNGAFNLGGNFEVFASPPPVGFLSHALDSTRLTFESNGFGWALTGDDSVDGIDSACSLPTPDNGTAGLRTSVTGPGNLKFQWRVDCEPNQDYLVVSSPTAAISESITGNTSWAEVNLAIPTGVHVVEWSFSKSTAGSSGEDKAWVDTVRFEAITDTEPPRIEALHIENPVLDVSGGPQTLAIRLEVTDDYHGFNTGTVELLGPGGLPVQSSVFNNAHLVSGNDKAGVYQVDFTVPPGAAPGLWNVRASVVENNTAASRTYGPGADPFPLTSSGEFRVSAAGSVLDEAPPTLGRIEVSRPEVDVTGGPSTVRVTVHAADLPSGMDGLWVSLRNPNGDWVTEDFRTGTEHTTGNIHNGIYQFDLVVPAFAPPGTWSVTCFLEDASSNLRDYPDPNPFPDGSIFEFSVANTGTVDLARPHVTSIAISPLIVDTSSGPAPVQVTVSLSDDVSGRGDAYAYFYNPADEFQGGLFTFIDASNRISGDDLNGTYRFSRTLPAGSMPGEWEVRIFVRDKVGRLRIYGQGLDAYPEPGDGVFEVGSSPLSWFENRMMVYELTGADALPGADPDGDGFSNAVEAISGSHPGLPSSLPTGFSQTTRDTTHLHFDFVVDTGLTAGTSGGFLTLGDGSSAPLRVAGETRHGGLSGVWNLVEPVPVGAGIYRISLPLAGGDKGFIRLRFENP